MLQPAGAAIEALHELLTLDASLPRDRLAIEADIAWLTSEPGEGEATPSTDRPTNSTEPATSDSDWRSAITPAETRVVELLAHGLTNAEIADRLVVSRRTVESHLYNVYPKLGVSSRTELAVMVAS